MHHQLLFLLLFLLLPDAATAGSCSRKCGGTTVPYPFGFSGGGGGDCPILLACNASASVALLPSSTAAAPYPVHSFNSAASTFLVTLAPSCNRSVSSARAALAGAGYGVSSRTGLFLRGGCGPATGGSGSNASSCNVPSGVMSALLRTAQCGGGGGGNDSTASWVCVLSAPPDPGSPAEARGEGQFMGWDKVAAAGCQDALTSAVYAVSAQGGPSIEFGIAEMGWWLNGSCSNSGGNGTAAAAGGGGQCAVNATCHDVQTPSRAWGHRCACANGMSGDGFAAGDGCYYGDGTPRGEC